MNNEFKKSIESMDKIEIKKSLINDLNVFDKSAIKKFGFLPNRILLISPYIFSVLANGFSYDISGEYNFIVCGVKCFIDNELKRNQFRIEFEDKSFELFVEDKNDGK